MNLNDPYLRYYRVQEQSGGGGTMSTVFRGARFQRGHGIGSFLAGLARTVMPLLKSGATALGKEALNSGVGFLGDIAAGTADPRRAADARLKQFTGGLKRRADTKLERVLHGGGGYKRQRITQVTPQSLAKLLRVRTSTKKKKTTKKRRNVKRQQNKRKGTAAAAAAKRKRKAASKKRKGRKTVKRRVSQDIFST